jgi:quercetin dioxygenase-like cupin family protein
MSGYFRELEAAARYSADRFTKADLFAGERLFVGLNCFEAGQTQPAHIHRGADKFYLIVSGRALMTVGDETREAGPGTVVWAPADVAHGVTRALERTVMLVSIAPPPRQPAQGGPAVDARGQDHP